MDPRDSYSKCVICLLTGSSAVRQATRAARSFGEAAKLDEDELARFCIIIEELVANLFEHGGVTSTDQIELMLIDEAQGIRVVLVDPGKPYDPRSAPSGKPNADRGGGVGLDIVRSWAQIIGYEVTSDGNKLEIILPIR